ncbi:MAG: Rieske (2Fe-2S) protein [Candidatus Obscuribacterales bacterium]|nr:Rieske (2Fe-2S) protein [Candidatus Obscuribacterales bacterium]
MNEQVCSQKKCRNLSRADFLGLAVPTFAAFWTMMAGYPIYRYLLPKPGEGEAQSKVGSVTLGAVGEVPAGTGKNFRFGSTPAIITHTEDGEFHAFKAICTHLGCTVQFREDTDQIWCACHGGCYDPTSGKNIAGPPPKPLEPLKVAVVDGKIVVSQG